MGYQFQSQVDTGPTSPILSQHLDQMEFIDLKSVLANHGARQLAGQGIEFKTDDEKIMKVWRQIKKTNLIDDWLVYAIEVCNYWGAVFPIIDKNKAGDWQFEIANPQFFNTTGRINVENVSASIYKQYTTGTGLLYERTIYTMKTINKMVATQGITTGDGMIVPPEDKESIVSQGVSKNPYGFIPVYRMFNVPNRNMMGNYYIINSDDRNVRNVPAMVNHLIRQMYVEAVLNKTRAFGDFTLTQMNQIINKGDVGQFYMKDFFTKVEGSGEGSQQVSILQGDPKFSEYLTGINGMISLYIKNCLYSDDNEKESSQTQAETLFTKSKDIETGKYKRTRYVGMMMKILDDIFVYEGLMKYEDERPYSIDIKDNIVINEIQLLAFITAAVDAELMSNVEGISKLQGISREEAKIALEQIVKDNDELAQKIGDRINEFQDGEEKLNSESLDPEGKKGKGSPVVGNKETK